MHVTTSNIVCFSLQKATCIPRKLRTQEIGYLCTVTFYHAADVSVIENGRQRGVFGGGLVWSLSAIDEPDAATSILAVSNK